MSQPSGGSSSSSSSTLQHLKALICCFKSGYDQIEGISKQSQLNYDEVKRSLEKFTRDWHKLHGETKGKLEMIIKEFSPYIDGEVKDEQKVINRAKQLSVEFEQLRKRHYELEATGQVAKELVESRRQYFQTRLSRITVHGRNAAVAATLLGAFIGATIGWQTYKVPLIAVIGAAIGLVGGGVLAAVVFFLFWRVTKNGVERWASLQTLVAEVNSLKEIIRAKAFTVQPMVDILKTVSDDVMCASMALVEQAKSYLK